MATRVFKIWRDTILGTHRSDDYTIERGANVVDMTQGGVDQLTINHWVGTLTLGKRGDTVLFSDGAGADLVSLGDGGTRGNTLDGNDAGYFGAIRGGASADRVTVGDAGAGSIILGGGADQVMSTGYISTIKTGGGNDRVEFDDAGSWRIETGAGRDRLTMTGDNAYVGRADLGKGADTVKIDGAGTVHLGPGPDTFKAHDWVGEVFGEGGRDSFTLKAGGNAYGGGKADTFNHGNGPDHFFGGHGADTFVFDADTAGAYDFIDGGAGVRDTLDIEVAGDRALAAEIEADIAGWSSGDSLFIDALNLQLQNVEFINVIEII